MNDSSDPDVQPGLERAELAKLKEMRLRRVSPRPDGRNAYEQLKVLVVEQLSAFIDNEHESLDETNLRPMLLQRFSELLVEERIVLKGSERRKLIDDVFSEVMDQGPQIDVDRSS